MYGGNMTVSLHIICHDIEFIYRLDGSFGLNVYINTICFILLVPASLLANTLVLYTFFKKRQRLQCYYLLICVVAGGDILNAFAALLWVTNTIMAVQFIHNCTLYIFTVFTAHYSAMLSFAFVTCITVDRYISIKYPFQYNIKFDTVTCWRIVLAIVLVNLILMLPGMKCWKCLKGFQGVLIFAYLLINTILYNRINMYLDRIEVGYRKSVGAKFSVCKITAHERKQHFLNKLIVFNLYLLYSPYLSIFLLNRIVQINRHLSFALVLWVFLLIGLKPLLNPILYCITRKTFRKEIKETLRKLKANVVC